MTCTINKEEFIKCSTPAKLYVNFKTFKIKWDNIIKDIIKCSKNYYYVNSIRMIPDNSCLTKQIKIVFNKDNKITEMSIFIGVDINADDVKFMYCLYSDFQHFGYCDTIEELSDVIIKSTYYQDN